MDAAKQDLQAATYLAEPNVVRDEMLQFDKFLERLSLRDILALQALLSQRALALQIHAAEQTSVLHNKPKSKLIF